LSQYAEENGEIISSELLVTSEGLEIRSNFDLKIERDSEEGGATPTLVSLAL